MWTLPGGGAEFGEHPEETVGREVREETGFLIDSLSFREVVSVVTDTGNERWHVLQFLYEGRIAGGVQTNEVGGSTDLCQWFSEDEARRLQTVPLARHGIDSAFAARSQT
jgi:ADP-ribose pyrophosphatase YjhB (NUDIX family)